MCRKLKVYNMAKFDHEGMKVAGLDYYMSMITNHVKGYCELTGMTPCEVLKLAKQNIDENMDCTTCD